MNVLDKFSTTAIKINFVNEVPLYQQFYEAIRGAILRKQFAPGVRLPASREMAREFGVSRNTVSSAYEQLIAEGYLETRTGSGTFVSLKIPDDLLNIKTKTNGHLQKSRGVRCLSQRGKLIANTPAKYHEPKSHVQPFVPCLPSFEDFPFQIWSKLVSRRLKRPIRSLLNYGEAAGYKPLREAIAAHLGASRAVRCEPEQVIVVSGTQQAVDLVARILLDPGDAVWVEDPSYLGMRGALIASGAKLVPVPVDCEGINITAGKKAEPNPKLICVTPSYQYPLGVTMSLARRLELLELARNKGAWILEDDYDSEFRYEGRPIAPLQGLDSDGRVIYVGTFSKILSPSLRLGYIIAPPDLVDAFISAKSLLDRHSPIFEQIILADFFNENHFARHIRRMRNLYAMRRDALTEALKNNLSDLIEIAPSAAGLHLTCWLLCEGIGDLTVAVAAANYDLQIEPLSALCIKRKLRPGFALGYASFDEKEIKEGIIRFENVLRTIRKE